MNLEIQILMLYLSNGEYNYGQFGLKHYCHSYIKVMKDANYSERTGLHRINLPLPAESKFISNHNFCVL